MLPEGLRRPVISGSGLSAGGETASCAVSRDFPGERRRLQASAGASEAGCAPGRPFLPITWESHSVIQPIRHCSCTYCVRAVSRQIRAAGDLMPQRGPASVLKPVAVRGVTVPRGIRCSWEDKAHRLSNTPQKAIQTRRPSHAHCAVRALQSTESGVEN